MAYLDAYLEPSPGYGWQGGPAFKTTIVTMRSGRERRNAEQEYARHSFTAPFLNIDRDAYRNIKQMHLVCRGMLHNFKFVDELDFEAENEVFAEGDGATNVFQLRKVSVVDGVSYVRNCYVINAAAVTDNDVAVAPTIDPDRGLATFSVPPVAGHVLRWTGKFAMWVRFNQDDLPFSLDNIDAINGSISLIEDRPPPL